MPEAVDRVHHFAQRHASWFVLVLLFLAGPRTLGAQSVDLLIQGGHVIDPANQIDQVMDVAISDGKIARVGENLSGLSSDRVVDATGLYVTPGLIDLHVHSFWGTDYERTSDGINALAPDGFTFRAGVTTVVDVGGSGWIDFLTFKDRVIDRSKTRVLSFLQIVKYGQKGTPYVQSTGNMDPEMAAERAQQFPEHIVGFKLAHYSGHDWEPVERVTRAGELAGLPVMIDFGGATPPLPLETLFMEKLRPGDIYTHAFGGQHDADLTGSGRQAIVDEEFQLRPFIADAVERGIVFDVGHGAGSFFYKQAIPAMEQGFRPTTISTDLYGSSMNTGMMNMTNVMSKFLDLGMTLQEVIEASTWKTAQVLSRRELGNLTEGAEADVTILRLEEGTFGFVDSAGLRKNSDQKLTAELTIRAGEVVWDLNGLAADPYVRN
ncbi:MAG: amidohydrolase/deacetylase family metallohydrolase [Balneolaceae bacterium]